MESKLGRAKQIASHPGATWATLLAVVIGVLQALTGTQTQALETLGFAEQTESSHYAALSDIRAKVDWLFMQVQGHGTQLAKLSVTPGGPGAQPPPPGAESDWHARYIADHCARDPSGCVQSDPPPTEPPTTPPTEPPTTPPAPPAEPPAEPAAPDLRQAPPFDLAPDGKPVWAPIERPTRGQYGGD